MFATSVVLYDPPLYLPFVFALLLIYVYLPSPVSSKKFMKSQAKEMNKQFIRWGKKLTSYGSVPFLFIISTNS